MSNMCPYIFYPGKLLLSVIVCVGVCVCVCVSAEPLLKVFWICYNITPAAIGPEPALFARGNIDHGYIYIYIYLLV